MLQQTVLVVEDDEMIRNLISLYLANENYRVIEAKDGEEAKDRFLTEHPCLIVLDLMLPKVSGEQFCHWVRHELQNDEVSILMLSAKSQGEDKINGLNLGADNYLTKPFNPDELVAYVEALLRRTKHYCKNLISDGLCLMPKQREVYLYDQQVHLTKHEFDLLFVLMSQPNIVFTREQLVNELYQFAEREILDRTIDAHIKNIREKIEDIPAKPERIKTVRGMGYRFVHTKSGA